MGAYAHVSKRDMGSQRHQIPLGTRITESCELPVVGLGPKLQSSARYGKTLNHLLNHLQLHHLFRFPTKAETSSKIESKCLFLAVIFFSA